MNFQVTVLKILVSYPGGFAVMADLKRDMAILATSGRDWAERTKRLGSRVPDLDIFSQRLIERLNGGWLITDAGRAVLAFIEARPPVKEECVGDLIDQEVQSPTVPLQFPMKRVRGRRKRNERLRAARERTRATAS